ncbi:MAG: CHAT domain-containing protein, partial [Alphaproteobacteria bacterium]|nr:CHAT domain-containing protein [Alphaproteobacteria bacterium]
EQRLRDELTRLGAEVDRLDRDIAERFPGFAELSDPRPLELAAAQALLKPGEAMLVYAVGHEQSFLWVVRRDAAAFVPLAVGQEELVGQVAALRAAVDPSAMGDPASPPAYPVAGAARLHRAIMTPAAPHLAGASHIIVVPDGPLQSLPFAILVDDAAAKPTAFLARKYAFSTLPGVSSLRALRRFARGSKASLPFVGFGDPVLAPVAGRAARQGRVRAAPASLFRQGAVADAAALRRLPSLPESAGELRMLAKLLKAEERHVVLGADATETRLRQTDLTKFRVVAFATHGLTSGEFPGVAEPALVLSPPQRPSPEDDGLLTASEIARLSLDADWTLLSACNTAAADGTPGAEGLSGLARAFFYAGSRALLVSHWPVESRAAPILTTGAIGALAREPGIGRAEALRRSMLEMMERNNYAHPMFWAPFVVVGEGGPAG